MIRQPVNPEDFNLQRNTYWWNAATCGTFMENISVTDLFKSVDNHTIIIFYQRNQYLSPTVMFYFNFMLDL